jgi:hypothetical protein
MEIWEKKERTKIPIEIFLKNLMWIKGGQFGRIPEGTKSTNKF